MLCKVECEFVWGGDMVQTNPSKYVIDKSILVVAQSGDGLAVESAVSRGEFRLMEDHDE